ncbi:MAG: TrkH family potassium uptake protein [Candidatus Hydrogenedentes bacterium]|nr:TrkH family potassium uptake protein [Candidatus Hydrogenedentota bacterium]
MNYRILSQYLGLLCIAVGLSMVFSMLWAVYYGEWHALEALVASMSTSIAIGYGLRYFGRNAPKRIFEREAIGLVGLTWIVVSVLGALPFVFAGILSFNDAFFESVSGFTTTGSTVITDIEAVDKSILFWRAFTHWLGGIGIVILFIAVLPYFGAGGKLIVKSESTGPAASLVVPRFRQSALIIFNIYFFFTVVNTIALMFAGMNFHEALCHAFAGLATGGYSTRQMSVGAFNSLSIEIVIIVFLLIGGTNFGLFAAMYLGDWKALLKDSEWRLFIGVFIVATALVTFNLMGLQGQFPDQGESFQPMPERQFYGFGHALRVGAFQVASCMTDTGFITDDFDRWPYLSRMILIVVMILGGSAGSTAGGLKIVRLLMFAKLCYWRLETTFRPKTVRPLRINGEVVSDAVVTRSLQFLCLYVFWFGFGCLFMSAMGLPFESAVSSMAACINNCGPGLEHVGAIRDFHLIGPSGTFFLSLTMLVGRLELVPILVLFVPAFWRR